MIANMYKFIKIARSDGIYSAIHTALNFIDNKIDRSIRELRLALLRRREGNDEIIRDINGSKMRLDIQRGEQNKLEGTLALKRIREAGITICVEEILSDLLNQFDSQIHVLDVGANIGYYTLLEARILGIHGKVHAIEAEPRNVERLKQNINLNGYANIEVEQVAAGEEHSTMELSIRKSSNLHKMKNIGSNDKSLETIDVEVVPLDSLIDKKGIPQQSPIVVRMDIEGYEGYAFKGMNELLSSSRPVCIIVEFHQQEYDPQKIVINLLKSNNFTIGYVSDDDGLTVRKPTEETPVIDQTHTHIVARNYNV